MKSSSGRKKPKEDAELGGEKPREKTRPVRKEGTKGRNLLPKEGHFLK